MLVVVVTLGSSCDSPSHPSYDGGSSQVTYGALRVKPAPLHSLMSLTKLTNQGGWHGAPAGHNTRGDALTSSLATK